MIAYKGMKPGMVCRGYQLRMGLNVTEQANCRENGFHCAANPMDCLRYYGDFQNSQEFFLHALAYMADHPQMRDGCGVQRERAEARNGYAVVRGKHPRAKGKLGDILAFARESMDGPKIEHLSLCVIDGKDCLPDIWYDDNFEECEAA